jgi:cyanophycinase
VKPVLAIALLALGALAALAEPPKGALVVVGGGSTPEGLHRRLLDLGGGTNANALIIPLASALTNAGDASVEALHKAGAVRISVLTAQHGVETARAVVRAADVIWFPGGDQSRLMAELQRLGVVGTIRERYFQGAVIGGTSAGAAVMSQVMITGKAKSPDDAPPTAEGLGLWPEVIVDQHFVKRGREPRLRKAVAAHPSLVGVGIDESTYVVMRGKTAEVFGRSSVTLLDARDGRAKPKVTVLKAGATFDLASETPK